VAQAIATQVAASVPAGNAPRRPGPDPAALSAQEKIAFALRQGH
jgi:hypothetical protein